MIKILACDIDGTISGRDGISDETMVALNRVKDAGVRIVFVSGRRLEELWDIAEEVDAYGFHVASSGGLIFHYDEHSIYSDEISSDSVRAILEAIEDGMELVFHVADRPAPWHALYNPTVVKGAVLNLDEETAKRLFDRLMDKASIGFRPELTQETFSDDKWAIDLLAKETSKGSALAKVAGLYKISMAEVAAIGDSWNDLTMFARSGMSIAMGMGVAASTDYVVREVDQGGFVEAVEKYIMPRVK